MKLFPILPILLLCFALVMTGAASGSDGSGSTPDKKDPPAGEQETVGGAGTTKIDLVDEEAAFNEFNLDEFIGIDIDVAVHGSLIVSSVWEDSANFTRDTAQFIENVARLGAEFRYGENLSAEIRFVGSDVHNRPEVWTDNRYTDWGMRTDLAYVRLSGLLGNLTVGYQELSYGDGFLIYDGYADKRAVWTNVIRSFPAVRWELQFATGFTLDLFTALVDEDYLNYEAWLGSRFRMEGGGFVSGADLTIFDHDTFGEIDIAVFYKEDWIEDDDPLGRGPDSTTWAVSLRDAVKWNDFTFIGEIVKQWGRTRVEQGYLTSRRHTRSALGGHATLRYDIPKVAFNPYLRGRWAQFSGDDPDTNVVEAFDPFFSGNRDWGNWYLGDISSYFFPNTNKRVLMAEAGIVPVERTSLRFIFYDIAFDQLVPGLSGSPQWTQEFNLVLDYKPCDWSFIGVLVGCALPGRAAKAYYGDNEVQKQAAVWAGINF